MSIVRSGTTARFSDFTVHNGVVYMVEIPPDMTGDITAQTTGLLDSVDKVCRCFISLMSIRLLTS